MARNLPPRVILHLVKLLVNMNLSQGNSYIWDGKYINDSKMNFKENGTHTNKF